MVLQCFELNLEPCTCWLPHCLIHLKVLQVGSFIVQSSTFNLNQVGVLALLFKLKVNFLKWTDLWTPFGNFKEITDVYSVSQHNIQEISYQSPVLWGPAIPYMMY